MLPLREMMREAKEFGVHFAACGLPMELMGFSKNEFIDEVDEVCSVGDYLKEAEDSDLNLFIYRSWLCEKALIGAFPYLSDARLPEMRSPELLRLHLCPLRSETFLPCVLQAHRGSLQEHPRLQGLLGCEGRPADLKKGLALSS